jgi:hypothetical protein
MKNPRRRNGIYNASWFQSFQKFQSFQPPPLSSAATRGRSKEGD